ncbi:hypothetical protein GCK32_004940 [Trichostrongylus colubriformis]|uniref:Uncharacterized protein n=1 Tax=Trichostrongylus colubriformis TaxID=6319 RepID=A0AAN8IJL4_TRICO
MSSIMCPTQPIFSSLMRMKRKAFIYEMRILSFILTIFAVLLSSAVTVNAFNVPPTGLCKVGKGGDCMRCDCSKPFTCYKGTCR